MVFADLETYLAAEIGLSTEVIQLGGQSYLAATLRIPGGSHEGESCQMALLRTGDNPWLPEAKLHVRPHLTEMGQNAANPSELGGDWQYLSRRFDAPPTPKSFYAHMLTVVSEL